MPRCPSAARQLLKTHSQGVLQDGRALLESRLHSLLVQLPRLEPHPIDNGSPSMQHLNWLSLLDSRLPNASEQQRTEATQALSPAWTALEACRRFHLHPFGSFCEPDVDLDAHQANIHFLGAQWAECYAPLTAFRDLADVLGHVTISLVGPLAVRSSIQEEGVEGIDVEIYKALYQDCEVLVPDLAVALNAGIQESSGKFWLPAMRRLVVGNVPTVITGYSREDIITGFACLLAHGVKPRVHFVGRNPFGSCLGPASGNTCLHVRVVDEEPDAFVEEAADLANRLSPSQLDGVVPLAAKRQLWKRSKDFSCRPGIFAQEPPMCNSYWIGFCGSHIT